TILLYPIIPDSSLKVLAFVENMQYMDGVKIGVLAGSLLSTLFGYFLILLTPNK
ncbi:hypothetical protein IDG52_02485, partial [Pelagibacterales bacterium SAG-MED23]|nr:hypothetical protein [Pelagibacterales bacterium SAG-MED23]